MTDSTDFPSAEAIEAAWHQYFEQPPSSGKHERILTAAYALDVPRIRAEERAATIRDAVAWLGELTNVLDDEDARTVRAAMTLLAARFNPEPGS